VRAIPRTDPLAAAARTWLRALERCVRAVDYAAARPLFARDVCAFGTHAAVARGRAALERYQWMRIWPSIRAFTFRLSEMRCVGSEAGLCVMAPWDSLGVRPDGTTFARPGRATLFLAPAAEPRGPAASRAQGRRARWVALHSHFSVAPETSPAPPGRRRRETPGTRPASSGTLARAPSRADAPARRGW